MVQNYQSTLLEWIYRKSGNRGRLGDEVCFCFGISPLPPCVLESWELIIEKLQIVGSLQTHVHNKSTANTNIGKVSLTTQENITKTH